MKIAALRASISSQVLVKSFSSFRGGKHPLSHRDRPIQSRFRLRLQQSFERWKFELRFLIPSSFLSRLIGTHGENVKALQAKSNAFMNVSQSCSPDGVLEVVCDRKNLKQCFESLIPFVQNANVDINQENMELRLLIHRSLVGQIKTKLGNSADCQIITFMQLCPLSTDQVVLIKADKHNLAELVQGLADLLCQFPINDHVVYYTGSSYKSSLVDSYGGFHNEFFSDRWGGMKSKSGRKVKPVDIVVKMAIC
uniref:K Homology domain-containing protein n=1 Tax=Ditylenchus dipsaci TaxID=166011 RepID=A0A915CNL3_9BILA